MSITKEEAEKLLQGCTTLEEYAAKVGLKSKQHALQQLIKLGVSRRKIYYPLTK